MSSPAVPAIDGGRRPGGDPGTSDPGEAAASPPKGGGERSCSSSPPSSSVGVFLYILNGRRFEETDDAQIDGNISNVGPRVTGTVKSVAVGENQVVRVGDLLLEIDATDLTVSVAQAKAGVAQAEAQLQAEDPTVSITETSNTAAVAGAASDLAGANAGVSGAQKDVEQLSARLVEAEGNARLAQLERQRGEELWKGQAIPRADYDRRDHDGGERRRGRAGHQAVAGGVAPAGAAAAGPARRHARAS